MGSHRADKHPAEAFAKANQLDAAVAALESVMKNSTEPGFKPIAGVRLAGLLLDQKKYDEATKAIDSGNIGPVSGEMAASVADRRGDILAAQGKASDAKAAWEEALKLLPRHNQLRSLVQYKLDAVTD